MGFSCLSKNRFLRILKKSIFKISEIILISNTLEMSQLVDFTWPFKVYFVPLRQKIRVRRYFRIVESRKIP
jgi:hypothetical protein